MKILWKKNKINEVGFVSVKPPKKKGLKRFRENLEPQTDALNVVGYQFELNNEGGDQRGLC